MLNASLGYSETKPALIFSLESTSYSSATSLYSISGHWNDKVSSGHQVWSINRMSLGFQYDDFTVQSIDRKDFNYAFDNETVRFLNLINNQSDLKVGKQYILNISPDKVAARGFRFGLNLSLTPVINIQTWLSVLQITELLDGQLIGVATAKAVNDYDFNFASDLRYGEDPLYGRKTNALSGRGYAIDLVINYHINNAFALKVELIDLFGELMFDQVPFTSANASSNIKNFDAEGYVKYDPSVSGFDGNKNYVKTLEGRQKIELSYRLALDKTVIIEHNNVFGFNYQKIKYQQKMDDTQLTFIFIPRLKALGMNWEQKYFSVGMEMDSFDYEKIKYLKLNALFHLIF